MSVADRLAPRSSAERCSSALDRSSSAAHGQIPGAAVIERNTLEWRLDPTSEHAISEARTGLPIILYCQEGYSTSLAFASLLDCGVVNVTDLEGGFEAWTAAGLPVARPTNDPAYRR